MKNPDRCFQLYWLTDQICLTVLSMDNLTKLDKVTASHSRLIVDGTIIFTAYFLGCCNYTTGLSFILAVKKNACNLHYLHTNADVTSWGTVVL